MLHASTQTLITKLCELTKAGEIAWKQTEDMCVAFETEGYVVELRSTPATLRILNADGRELERADAGLLGATPSPDGLSFLDHVTQMIERAKRAASPPEAAPPAPVSRPLSPAETSSIGGYRFSNAAASESDAAWASAAADMTPSAASLGEDLASVSSSAAAGPPPLVTGVHAVTHQMLIGAQPLRRTAVEATPIGDALEPPKTRAYRSDADGRGLVTADAYKPWI